MDLGSSNDRSVADLILGKIERDSGIVALILLARLIYLKL